MAQAWKWLGAEEVTVVELADHLLPREETFAGEELETALSRMGIMVHTSASTRSVTRIGQDGPATVEIELVDGEVVKVETDEIIVATGRRPNTGDLGLESVGLEPSDSIKVDDHLQATDVPGGWLYAVGDVNGRTVGTSSPLALAIASSGRSGAA